MWTILVASDHFSPDGGFIDTCCERIEESLDVSGTSSLSLDELADEELLVLPVDRVRVRVLGAVIGAFPCAVGRLRLSVFGPVASSLDFPIRSQYSSITFCE